MRLALPVVLCLLVTAAAATEAGAAEVFGRVVDANTGLAIEGAGVAVTLDGATEPSATDVTNPLGTFRLAELAAGTVDLTAAHPAYAPSSEALVLSGDDALSRVIELVPLSDAADRFDVYLQVMCTHTTIALAGAAVTVDVYSSESGGGLLDERTVSAGPDGTAVIRGLPRGWAVFSVTHGGWEPFTWPATGRALIDGHRSATIGLKPRVAPLTVTVRGDDPTADTPSLSPLSGVMVEITGLDPGTMEPLLPPRAYLTDDAGQAVFLDLPPIVYRVRARRLGYDLADVVVGPNFAGPDAFTFDSPTIELALSSTVLRVVPSTPWGYDDIVTGAAIELEGVADSNTAGISRSFVADFAPGPGGSVAGMQDRLLPGTYWLRVRHATRLEGFPREGGLYGDDGYDLAFEPAEVTVDVLDGETRLVEVPLVPIPATVHVRLLYSDAVGEAENVERVRQFFSFYDRLFTPVGGVDVSLVEHATARFFGGVEGLALTGTTSDDGWLTLRVPPGRWGATADLASATGGSAQLDDLDDASPPAVGPWPYPESWPYPHWERDHTFGPPEGPEAFDIFSLEGRQEHFLTLDSGHEYRLELHTVRPAIDLVGLVRPDDAPEDGAVDPSLSGAVALHVPQGNECSDPSGCDVLVPVTELTDLGGEAVLSGDDSRTVDLGSLEYGPPIMGTYFIPDVGPGSYTLTAAHDRMTFTSFDFEIAPWPAPGTLPSVAPDDPTFFVPGLPYRPGPLEATWTGALSDVSWVIRSCGVGDPASCDECFVGLGSANDYYSTDYDGDLVWPSGFLVPGSPWTVWLRFDADPFWAVATGTGDQTPSYWLAGGSPLSCPTPSTPAPPLDTDYHWEIRTFTDAGRLHEVSEVEVEYEVYDAVGGSTSTVSDTTPVVIDARDGRPAFTFTDVAWTVTSTNRRLELSPLRVYQDVYVERAQALRCGTDAASIGCLVEGPSGPLGGVPIAVRSGFGAPLEDVTTSAAGAFEAGPFSAQPLVVDIDVPGYYPERFCTAVGAPDVSLTTPITLTPLEPPPVPALALDRGGIFVPGLTRGAEADALTLRWTVTVGDPSLTYTLRAFDGCAEPATTTDYTVPDPVQEVWLIDPREWPEPWARDPSQTPTVLDVPAAGATYAEVRVWLDGLRSRNVVASPALRRDPTSGDFTATLDLARLPPGDFEPIVVVVTQRGRFRIHDPAWTDPPLVGLTMPRWATSFLELLGVAASASLLPPGVSVTTDPAEFVPQGLFVPRPDFEAAVAANDDGTLTYDYGLGVDWVEGVLGPHSGPLAGGPASYGVSLSSQARFVVNGGVADIGDCDAEPFCCAADSVCLGVTGQLDADLEDELKARYGPVLASGGVAVDSADLTGTGTVQIIDYLDPSSQGSEAADAWRAGARVPSFELRATSTLFGHVRFAYDLVGPLLSKVLYVGPVLLGLEEAGLLAVDATLDVGAGGGVTRRVRTFFPPPYDGGSIPVDPALPGRQPRRWGFLGATDVDRSGCAELGETDVELCTVYTVELLFGVGLKVRLGSDTFNVGAHAGLQVGAPVGSDANGLRLTLNRYGEWPLLRRIEGALSATVDVSARAWVLKYGKHWQWDLVSVDWQLGTEPFLDLRPLGVEQTLVSPATATPATFVGSAPDVLLGFYEAGSLDLGGAANPAAQPFVAYTDVDDATDEMVLRVTRRGAVDWHAPVELARAAGILGVSVAPAAGGGWLAVWTALDGADVADPTPATAVYWSRSDDAGETWSSPALLAAHTDAAFAPHLALAGDRDVLVYASTNLGPNADESQLNEASFDGGAWSTPGVLRARAPMAGLDLAAAGMDGGRQALLLVYDGAALSAQRWSDGTWQDAGVVAAAAEPAFAAAFLAEGTPLAAWSDAAGVHLSARATGWIELGLPVPDVVPAEVAVGTMLGQAGPLYLLAWASAVVPDQRPDQTGDATPGTRLDGAFFNGDGAVVEGPFAISTDTTGTYHDVHLWSRGGYAAGLLAEYTASPTAVRELAAAFTGTLPPCASGAPCDDGDACTPLGTCDAAAACQLGSALACSGGGACATAACDPERGVCVLDPAGHVGEDCDADALGCTSATCQADGSCLSEVDAGCVIDGACVAEGVANDANRCQVCAHAEDPTGWSFASAATVCGPAACVDSATRAAAATCDGAGSCAPPATTNCTPFACSEDACLTDCVGPADCVGGAVCHPAGVCVPAGTPSADAGPDQTVAEDALVTLDGRRSSDPEGAALAFSWSQASGPAVTLDDPTSPTPTFAAPVIGTGATDLTFALVVSDGALSSPEDVASVTVEAGFGNTVPTAAIDGPASAEPGASVVLSGAASEDADGDPLDFLWSQHSGPAVAFDDPTAETVTIELSGTGVGDVLSFSLVVDDGFANSAVALHDLTVVEDGGDDAGDAGGGDAGDVGADDAGDADGDDVAGDAADLGDGGGIEDAGDAADAPTDSAGDVGAGDAVTDGAATDGAEDGTGSGDDATFDAPLGGGGGGGGCGCAAAGDGPAPGLLLALCVWTLLSPSRRRHHGAAATSLRAIRSTLMSRRMPTWMKKIGTKKPKAIEPSSVASPGRASKDTKFCRGLLVPWICDLLRMSASNRRGSRGAPPQAYREYSEGARQRVPRRGPARCERDHSSRGLGASDGSRYNPSAIPTTRRF